MLSIPSTHGINVNAVANKYPFRHFNGKLQATEVSHTKSKTIKLNVLKPISEGESEEEI
jgi:hypothetical protein